VIECLPLTDFDTTNWEQINQAFSKAAPLELKQFWLPQLETHFEPTEVRLGWRPDAFFVLANLQDCDIFSKSAQDGEPMWQLGDVFEIFLGVSSYTPWYEFHVTPNNHHLELCWPDDHKTCLRQEKQRGYKAFLVAEPIIKSYVDICNDQQRWQVLTEIPSKFIVDGGLISAGQQWRVSFCRYNVFQDERSTVLSSTSDFTEPTFSRQHEWRRLVFTS
jgi:hypothetical protein